MSHERAIERAKRGVYFISLASASVFLFDFAIFLFSFVLLFFLLQIGRRGGYARLLRMLG